MARHLQDILKDILGYERIFEDILLINSKRYFEYKKVEKP